jgi:hypothetical protein
MTKRHVEGRGVEFRTIDGRRSSQAAGKQIFAEAAGSVDPSLAKRIENEPSWRKTYFGPLRELVEAGAASPKDALRIAAAGLGAVHASFVFVSEGQEIPLIEAVERDAAARFSTGVIEGEGERVREVMIPYRGRTLTGDSLTERLDAWVRDGVIEPSCAAAVTAVTSNPEWLDLSDRTIVLTGAGAEMGPLEHLCGWGAEVVAVDLPIPRVWERIARTAKLGSGRLHLPTTAPGTDAISSAGADLLTETSEIRTWLSTFEGPLTIGNYAYADGSNFPRVAAALDALTVALLKERPDASIAYLATPTDVFAVPEEVVKAATGSERGRFSGMLRGATGGRAFVPNYARTITGDDGRLWGIADSLVPQQGPNYALAKMLQRWRAVSAREDGVLTSANVAPATRTTSVVKNKILAAAYRGASAFGVEIFEPETSRALMATLLVHDLRNPQAPANPGTVLPHPFDLFTHAAAHGGLWRNPHEARSVLPLAAVVGLVKRR